MDLYKYLESKGVTKAEMDKMRANQIDENVIVEMSINDIREYISSHGVCVTVKKECQKMISQLKEEKEKHLLDRLSNSHSSILTFMRKNTKRKIKHSKPAVSTSGITCSINLKVYSKKKLTKQIINVLGGGGRRDVEIPTHFTSERIIELAQGFYFPGGKSFRFGDIDDYNFQIEDNVEVPMKYETFEEMHKRLCMKKPAIFLVCYPKDLAKDVNKEECHVHEDSPHSVIISSDDDGGVPHKGHNDNSDCEALLDITTHNVESDVTVISDNVDVVDGVKIRIDSQHQDNFMSTSILNSVSVDHDYLSHNSVDQKNYHMSPESKAILAPLDIASDVREVKCVKRGSSIPKEYTRQPVPLSIDIHDTILPGRSTPADMESKLEYLTATQSNQVSPSCSSINETVERCDVKTNTFNPRHTTYMEHGVLSNNDDHPNLQKDTNQTRTREVCTTGHAAGITTEKKLSSSLKYSRDKDKCSSQSHISTMTSANGFDDNDDFQDFDFNAVVKRRQHLCNQSLIECALKPHHNKKSQICLTSQPNICRTLQQHGDMHTTLGHWVDDVDHCRNSNVSQTSSKIRRLQVFGSQEHKGNARPKLPLLNVDACGIYNSPISLTRLNQQDYEDDKHAFKACTSQSLKSSRTANRPVNLFDNLLNKTKTTVSSPDSFTDPQMAWTRPLQHIRDDRCHARRERPSACLSSASLLPDQFILISSDSEEDSTQCITSSDNHLASNNGVEISKYAFVTLHHGQIFEDMLESFSDVNILSKTVYITRYTCDGKPEKAVDDGGVTRDVLTQFWHDLYIRQMDGEEMKVPRLSPSFLNEWSTVARIIAFGWKREKYWPIIIPKAAFEYCFWDRVINEDELVDQLMHMLPFSDAQILRQPLTDPSVLKTEEFLDVLDKLHCKSTPKPGQYEEFLKNLAHIEILSRAMSAYEEWKPILKVHAPITLQELNKNYETLKPTNGRVVDMLVFPSFMNKDACTLKGFLVRYLETVSFERLQRFLRFCTGSDLMVVSQIDVQFFSEDGIKNSPQSHTCHPVLKLPYQYSRNYDEFCKEFDIFLENDWSVMDVI